MVSIIVPTRNAAGLMPDFLRACAASSYPWLEVVVNDDPRSEDDLRAVLATAPAGDLHTVYLRENRSMAQGRRSAARHASGEVLMHLDADMRITPGLVGECVARLRAGADALVIPEISVGRTFWARCKALEKRCYDGVERIESLRVLTRACYEALGGHDPAMVFSEDKDLDLRVRAAGYRVGRTDAALLHDEGALSLRRTVAKKLSYSATSDIFAQAHPDQFRWQRNILHRYGLYLRNTGELRRHPALYCGLFLMKTAEYGAAALGAALARGGGTGGHGS